MAVRTLREHGDEFTIDQLAQASGVTVRNIRAHQSRGLLPAPTVRGRTGYYTAEHLDRLRLISEMQADGFNLSSIKRILDNIPAGSAGQVLNFEAAIRAPWSDEQPEIFTTLELAEMFGGADDQLLRKAVKLGLLVPLAEDQYEAPSPSLLRAGAEMRSLGLGIDELLGIVERIQRHTEGVARTFTDVFVERIWKPFQDAGRPEHEWPRIHEVLDRLRPLATEVLMASFSQSMARSTDAAFGKVLENVVRAPRANRQREREQPPKTRRG